MEYKVSHQKRFDVGGYVYRQHVRVMMSQSEFEWLKKCMEECDTENQFAPLQPNERLFSTNTQRKQLEILLGISIGRRYSLYTNTTFLFEVK
jgi:hypothetical protein